MTLGTTIFSQTDIQRFLSALASAGALRGPEYHRALADVGLVVGLRLAPANIPPRVAPPEVGWRLANAEHQVEVLA